MAVHLHRSLLLIIVLALTILAYTVPQAAFGKLVLYYGIAFGAYAWAGLHKPASFEAHSWLNWMVKLVLVFSLPLASDDFYRFYWDGMCVLEKINPYQFTPHELQTLYPQDWMVVFTKLNSPNYFSVYPPILQALFAMCAIVGFKSIYLFSVSWKMLLFLSDVGTIYFLKKLIPKDKIQMVWWYAWNPLILFEIIANGHPEGFIMFFIVTALYYLFRTRYDLSSVMLSLAAAIKIFPIILLPFLWKYLGFKKGLRYSLLSVLIFILCLCCIYPYQDHFMQSIRLYISSFEFNGSLFEIWKAIDYQRFGFDNVRHIGQYLSVLFILWTTYLFIRQKSMQWSSLLPSILLMWMGYLLLSTTVHPWYILPLLLLSTLSGWLIPFIWSGLIVLSYSWYDPTMSTTWKYALIGIEYMVLLIFFLVGRNGLIRFNLKDTGAHSSCHDFNPGHRCQV